MSGKPLVSIVCATYNHELYIAQAIESFLMQKTAFEVEIIIGEDCSADKTKEICIFYKKKHLDKIKLLLQEKNIGAMQNHVSALRASEGKYIANCDGDDYWTDSYKLQKQVDYMERHPECSLCFHAVEIVKGKTKTGKIIRAASQDKIFPSNQLFGLGPEAPTSSLLFKKKSIENLPQWLLDAPVGDIPLKLTLAQHGTVAYINEVMSIRRVGVPSSFSDRMYDYRSRRLLYPQMIKMLDNFNQSTNFQFSNDILAERMHYELITLVFQDKTDIAAIRRLARSSKYYDCIRRLSIKKKMRFYLIYLFPSIYKRICSSRIGWAVKNSIFSKNI
ncbi:glycosyltransferase [Candidatus Uhrbacteria bacterium]|nr:glycosyltransferase [Candidatus Uhrbacteria bacterium]